MRNPLDSVPKLSVIGQDNSALFHASPAAGQGAQLPPALAQHRAFAGVFQKGKLTVGIAAPFKGYADVPVPSLEDLGELAQLADRLGFAALWLRDVPFLDPHFGDVGQALDPYLTLGYLAAKTENIALGTAGLIAPLRSPIHMAKAAASAEVLSGGRFLLGLSSGDRPVEYPAFKADYDNRAERFREAWAMIRTLLQDDFPRYRGTHYGDLRGDIDLVPKISHRLPMIAIGRARQALEWLANTADAWLWHGVNPRDTANVVQTLAELNQDGHWRPFGYANFVELLDDANASARLYNHIYLRGGSKAIAAHWQEQREQGLAHVVLNLKPTRRPAAETLQDLAENVLPGLLA
mgnify:CR=1 FL=1